jgi:hypothetical protein
MALRIGVRAGLPGDIVFITSNSIRAKLNLTGQDLLRSSWIRRGKINRARYSHVMLVLSPGLVVHADGKSVAVQPIKDVAFHEADGYQIKAVRFGDATDELRKVIAHEALKFLKQKYSFIYARRSSTLGKVLHRSRARTLPLCSELVAVSFGAAGIQICSTPYDRTLPVDLEANCVPPVWKDVTDELESSVRDFASTNETEVPSELLEMHRLLAGSFIRSG